MTYIYTIYHAFCCEAQTWVTDFELFNPLRYVWFDERYRLEYSSLIALTTFLALSVYLSIQLYVSSLKCFHDYNSQVNHVVQWALDRVKDLEFDLSCCILFECGVSCSYYYYYYKKILFLHIN